MWKLNDFCSPAPKRFGSPTEQKCPDRPQGFSFILNLLTLPADLGSHVPCHLNLRSPVPIILAMLP